MPKSVRNAVIYVTFLKEASRVGSPFQFEAILKKDYFLNGI